MQSLATVVSGALPLLCCGESCLGALKPSPGLHSAASVDVAISAQIIRAVRAYVIAGTNASVTGMNSMELLEDLRHDEGLACHGSVFDALENVVRRHAVEQDTIEMTPVLA